MNNSNINNFQAPRIVLNPSQFKTCMASHLSQNHGVLRWAWYEIYLSFNAYPKEQKRFLFDFQLYILATLWNNFPIKDKTEIKRIVMNFYNVSLPAAELKIHNSQKAVPEFTLIEAKLKEVPSYIELLDDTYKIFDDGRDYTFGEAVSLMSEELGYPQEHALKILEHMGYIQKNRT